MECNIRTLFVITMTSHSLHISLVANVRFMSNFGAHLTAVVCLGLSRIIHRQKNLQNQSHLQLQVTEHYIEMSQ